MSDTPLLPEQQQALEYLRRKGTEAPAETIRRKSAAAFEQIEALLATVPGDLHRRAPSPGRWSPQEILDHLVESHRPAAAQLASLLAGRRPASGAIPAGLQSASPLTLAWGDLYAALREVHAELLRLLESLPEELPRSAPRAPIVMVVKAAQADGSLVPLEWEAELDAKAFAQALRVHTLEHVGQLQRTVAQLEQTAPPAP